MKIKHILTLFCVTLTLAFFLLSCADTPEDGEGGETEYTGPFEASNVSARQCTSSLSTLNCFISVWNTENSGGGASATSTIVLPLVESGTYDFYVNWGDESDVQNITSSADATHTYKTGGIYTIYIADDIKGWRFYSSDSDFGDAVKLLDVEQWGSLSLGNTEGRQFQGAAYFNPTATDAPDVSETTDLSSAFEGATNFNGQIGNWDMSKITTMNAMFSNAASFNQDIGGWNVPEVTDMAYMFSGASSFNQDISEWDVSKVTSFDSFDKDSVLEIANVPFNFREIDTISEKICADNPRSNCFISVWNTENVPTATKVTGYSGTMSVKLPLVSEGTYDFHVDWGDGTVVQQITSSADATHTYTTPGEYTVYIAGNIKGWRFYVEDDNYGDAVKLTDVTKWGSLSLGNTAGRQFQGAQNFNPTAVDALDLSDASDLSYAFNLASSFNADISDWDVGNVTSMERMFFNSSSFNNADKALTWGNKTSKVTNMSFMFYNASAFNQDISEWAVDQVTRYASFAENSGLELNNLPDKFRGNGKVSEAECQAIVPTLNCFISIWDTSKIDEDRYAADHASKISGASDNASIMLPLVSSGSYDFYVDWGDGNVQRITNYSEATHTYNKPGFYQVYMAGTIEGWRFGDGSDTYGDAVKLLDVIQWGPLSLGNTEGRQFQYAENFNPTAVDALDLSKTTNLNNAFQGASNFDGAIGNWDVSQVTDMSSMFNDASRFNQDISEWNVSKVTSYNSFDKDSGLEVNNVPLKFRALETVSKELCDANPLTNCFISVWNTANTGGGASDNKTIVLPLVGDGTYNFYVDWGDESDVQNITNYSDATHEYATLGEYTVRIAGKIKGWRFHASDLDFGDAVKLLNVTKWGSLSLGNTAGKQFWGAKNFNPTAVDALDLSDTSDLSHAFEGATIFNGEMSHWDVSKVTNMAGMFQNASAFNKPLNAWGYNTIAVTNMNSMFNNASSFDQALSEWWPSEVTNMAAMFKNASAFNQDLSRWNWKVENVTDMAYMFQGASAFNQDISNWNIKKVTSMTYMFQSAISFNNSYVDDGDSVPLDWGDKTQNVTNMSFMFQNASVFNQSLRDWNTTQVTDMEGMFQNAETFDKSLCEWDVSKVTSSNNFATGSAMRTWDNPFECKN